MNPRLSLQPPTERQAFEVENIRNRNNFTFVFEPTTKQVDMFDTSRQVGKRLEMTYREKGGLLLPVGGPRNANMNPLDCFHAYDYFKALYDKSLRGLSGDICFLGWVDPDTIQPLAELYEDEFDEELYGQ